MHSYLPLDPEVEGKREAINYHSPTSSQVHTSAWKGSYVYPSTLPEPAAAPHLWVTGYDTGLRNCMCVTL